MTRRSCIIDVSAAVFNEESTEEQKTDHESVSFDTGTVSVIEEEEPTDLDCSESLMTIKSYRDTQKKVTKSGRVTKMLTIFFRENRGHVASFHFRQFNFCRIQIQMSASSQPNAIKKNVQGT